jgi:hypothetical protein
VTDFRAVRNWQREPERADALWSDAPGHRSPAIDIYKADPPPKHFLGMQPNSPWKGLYTEDHALENHRTAPRNAGVGSHAHCKYVMPLSVHVVCVTNSMHIATNRWRVS